MSIKIEIKGFSRQFLITDTVTGIKEPYRGSQILIKKNSQNNIEITQDYGDSYKKAVVNMDAPRPFTDFVDASGTPFESADAIEAWGWDNVGFKSASGGSEAGVVYGVEWNINNAAPELTRIGSEHGHSILPIQSRMKGCTLFDNGKVNYYLDPEDWAFKQGGGRSQLDGTDGQVMVEIPRYFIKFSTIGDLRRVEMSLFYFQGAQVVQRCYVGAYKSALHRPTNKLASVANASIDYRGGNNNATIDSLPNSQLGKPATAISRVNFKIYASNRGSGWYMINYRIRKSLLWLMSVEFANKNSQAYSGEGPTNIISADWSSFSGYYPLFNCGLTNDLGNGSGANSITISDFPTSGSTKNTQVIRYRGVENLFGDIWEWMDGVNIDVNENSLDIYVANGMDTSNIGFEGYTKVGEFPKSNGYIKELLFGENGDVFPVNITGASSTTYWCDYFYQNFNSKGLRGLLVGGAAYYSAAAGAFCVYSTRGPSGTDAIIGSRLCFQNG